MYICYLDIYSLVSNVIARDTYVVFFIFVLLCTYLDMYIRAILLFKISPIINLQKVIIITLTK